MPALGGKMLVNMFGIGDVMERRRNREESQRAERYLRSPQGQTSPFARRRSNSVDNWQLSGPIRQGPSNPAWFRPQSALSRQQSRWVSSRPQSRDRNRGWETPPPLFTDQSPPPRRRRRLVSPYEEDVREGWSNGEFSAIPDMSDEEDEDEDEVEYYRHGSETGQHSRVRLRPRTDSHRRHRYDYDDQRRQSRPHRHEGDEGMMYERYGGMPRVHGQYPRDRYRTGYDRGSPYDIMGT